MLKSELIKKVTDEFISSSPMLPGNTRQISEAFMLKLREEFQKHNENLKKKDRLAVPTVLPNACIADFILHLYPVKFIDLAGKDKAKNYLAIYQTDGSNAGLYVEDEAYLSKLVRSFKYTATSRDVAEVVDILKADAAVVSPNINQDLVAVNNGIFDYRTKQLLPFSPEYVFTAKSKVNYIPNCQNPIITNPDGTLWDVESWMASLSDDPEIVQLLWEVVGAIIRPHVRWDKVVCLYSQRGMNGKGTFCELLKQICGEGVYTSIPFDAFSKDFMLSPLTSCTAIITDENATTEFSKNPANLKAVITGDCFQINRKYKEPITICFSGLMVQCINALPKFGDTTESLYRRFLIIPFEKTFMGCERKYIKSEYLHRQDVLEYVLCKVLNTNYYEFSNPEACKDALNDYKEFNDLIRQFADEILDECVWDLLPWNFLYSLYKAWAKRNAPSAVIQSSRTFIDKMKNIIDSDYSDRYKYSKNPYSVNNHMQKTETLIAAYGLTDWMDSNYKGGDVTKICNPPLAAGYRGLLRITP